MAVENYTEPLMGSEIINDLVDQIASRLEKDCNLRTDDSYSGGYSAVVDVKLFLYGIDTPEVTAHIEVGTPQDDPNAVVVEEKIEVPVEPALDMVRERSGQPIPTLTEDTAGLPVVKRRKYTRRAVVAGPGAGAVDEQLETE